MSLGTAAYRPQPVVLVIDDEPGVREAVRELFKHEFEVLEAETGAAGLELIRARRVDVALLDVRLPGERGPAVLPRILAIDDGVAVILMTAVPDVRTAVECIKAGAYEYIAKPFDVDEMTALVRQAAEQRRLEREVERSGPSSSARTASTRSSAGIPRWCACTS